MDSVPWLPAPPFHTPDWQSSLYKLLCTNDQNSRRLPWSIISTSRQIRTLHSGYQCFLTIERQLERIVCAGQVIVQACWSHIRQLRPSRQWCEHRFATPRIGNQGFLLIASQEKPLTARPFTAADPQDADAVEDGLAPPYSLNPKRVTLDTTWSIASDAPDAQGVNGKSLDEATIICGGDAIGSENTTSLYGRLLHIDSGAFIQ